MRQTKAVISLMLFALTSTGYAQKASAPLTVEDEKAYIDAQIELLKKKGDLIAAQRNVAGNSMLNLPQVASISKVGSKYVALLQYSNGTTDYVQENELLRQGVLITAITRKQVIVSVIVGKKTVPMPLDFVAVSNPSMQPNMNGQNATNSIPPELLPAAPSIVLPATPPVLGEAHKAPVSAPAAPAAAPAAQAAPATKGK